MWLGLCGYNSSVMSERISYKVKHIRMSEQTWGNLKLKRGKSGKSWNLFLVTLLNDHAKQSKKNS